MNLDDLTEVWRSQDLSPLYGVDKTLLHQVLRQEQAKREKLQRRVRWFSYFWSAVLLLMAALFLAIMIDPNDDDVLIVWDYVVGVVGVVTAIILAATLFALWRSQQARAQAYGDSLRDHLCRRIAQLDAEATGERRLALIAMALAVICACAVSIASYRINDVPWGEFRWRPRIPTIAMLAFFYLWLFRWAPRERQRNAARKRQLEALLKEIDGS